MLCRGSQAWCREPAAVAQRLMPNKVTFTGRSQCIPDEPASCGYRQRSSHKKGATD
jgi:hypothetical protein